MYKCLFVLLALTSGSLCQENVNLTDTLQNIDNLYDGAKPVERFTRQASPRPSVINMHGYYNYHADQQVFFVNGLPQNLRRGGKTCLSYLERDDYTVTPEVGAHKLHPRKVKWNQARKACMDEGGHLAIINSDREAALLLDMMKKANIIPVWVGLHDMFKEGDWMTIFGNSMESTGFNKWSTMWPNEPDNLGGNQNCGVFEADGGIDDVVCDLHHSYVCEIELC